jgi:hypothetical protein
MYANIPFGHLKSNYKHMKTSILLLMCFFVISTLTAQTVFKSPKYGYSFTVPDGWRVKDEIYLPGTDAKIVDDKGNSFVVTIRPLPADYKNVTSKSLLEKSSNEELVELWAASYNDAYVLKRGSTFIADKEFYYVHMSFPFKGSLRLIHKMFMYNWKGNTVSIDCASISSMTSETSVYFEMMLKTFKFP